MLMDRLSISVIYAFSLLYPECRKGATALLNYLSVLALGRSWRRGGEWTGFIGCG